VANKLCLFSSFPKQCCVNLCRPLVLVEHVKVVSEVPEAVDGVYAERVYAAKGGVGHLCLHVLDKDGEQLTKVMELLR
jgi:hypothetical protein